MLFSFHFGSFSYSGVCSNQLKLSIYDVIVVQNSSNGDVTENIAFSSPTHSLQHALLFLGCVFLDKYIVTDLVHDRLKTLSITIV